MEVAQAAPAEAPQAVTWERELADVDEQIAFHEARFRDKGSWLEAEAAARTAPASDGDAPSKSTPKA